MLADCRPVVQQAMRRFALLGAAVAGSADRWVVTHGEPHAGNVVGSPDGQRLVDWATLRLAPRERDLREVLGESEGNAPWFAYVEAGGRPEPLSPDALELFALEWHLSEIAEYAVLFSGPHDDTADARRSFGDLETATAALVEGWS
jgi:spectinomycin phosphotransferase